MAGAKGSALCSSGCFSFLKPAGQKSVAVRSTTASGSMVYESSRAVEEYLHFHFGLVDVPKGLSFASGALEFPARMALLANKYSREDRREVAYDIGCAVGRGSFEMARTFKKVVGIDFSNAFIEAAQKLQKEGTASYTIMDEGLVKMQKTIKLPEGMDVSRVEFRQGDACALGDIGEVDCMTAVNLLCRLPEPIAFLEKAIEAIRPGGLLVLVSPYSWLEEYTKQENWLGGKYDTQTGKPISSEEQVKAILTPFFNLVDQHDEPFLIREHSRKFQLGMSDCCIWRRRD